VVDVGAGLGQVGRRAVAALVEVLDWAAFTLTRFAGEDSPVQMPVRAELLAASGAPGWFTRSACCDADRPHAVSPDGQVVVEGFPHVVALPAPAELWPES
jgi:hypothetical protein